jgi:hypothetical protein
MVDTGICCRSRDRWVLARARDPGLPVELPYGVTTSIAVIAVICEKFATALPVSIVISRATSKSPHALCPPSNRSCCLLLSAQPGRYHSNEAILVGPQSLRSRPSRRGLAVELIDKGDDRDFAQSANPEELAGLSLDALGGIQQHHRFTIDPRREERRCAGCPEHRSPVNLFECELPHSCRPAVALFCQP